MANYTLQSHNGTGYYLSADGTATSRGTVSIKARVASSLDQTWRIDEVKSGMRTRLFPAKTTNATGFCLNVYRSTYNCDISSYMNN